MDTETVGAEKNSTGAGGYQKIKYAATNSVNEECEFRNTRNGTSIIKEMADY
jgi:hypothetical protein